MIILGTLAICAPLTIGFILGERALGGMLVGGITSGFMLAVYMANSGGAWDNAKKVNVFSENLSLVVQKSKILIFVVTFIASKSSKEATISFVFNQ